MGNAQQPILIGGIILISDLAFGLLKLQNSILLFDAQVSFFFRVELFWYKVYEERPTLKEFHPHIFRLKATRTLKKTFSTATRRRQLVEYKVSGLEMDQVV